MNTEPREISALRQIAYGAKIGRARKVAHERFDAALSTAVDWDMPRREIHDGTAVRFAALGSIEEAGRAYRVAVHEYAGGRAEVSLWLLDGKIRQDQGDQVKPHLRAAALLRYLEVRTEQRRAKRAEVLAAEALAAEAPASGTIGHLERRAGITDRAAFWKPFAAIKDARELLDRGVAELRRLAAAREA